MPEDRDVFARFHGKRNVAHGGRRILRAAIILVYVGQMLGQNDTFFLFFHIKFLWKI